MNTCVKPSETLATEIWALTPTITSPIYPNPYDYPINFEEWKELLPSNDCKVVQVAGTSTGVVLTQARAVTDTTTSYGVVVNRQEPTPTPVSNDQGESDNDDSVSAASENNAGQQSHDDSNTSQPAAGSGEDESSRPSSPAPSVSASASASGNAADSLSSSAANKFGLNMVITLMVGMWGFRACCLASIWN